MTTHRITDLIENSAIEAQGALDFDPRGEGVSPRRLPAWTRAQLPEPMDVMVRMPSGVRLVFQTESRRVGLSFLASNMVMPGVPRRPISFNLELDPAGGGAPLSASSTRGNQILVSADDPGAFEVVRGEPDTIWFDDLTEGSKRCELWLPHNAFIELREIIVDDGTSIGTPAPDGRRRWIHYGSSISHCTEAEEPAYIWPAVAARSAGLALQNLGFGGQCHLDQFVARTIRDSDADLVSIKTGINVVNMDSMRERVFAPAVHGFLDTVREGKPDAPIVVISPIFCPSAEDRPGPTVPDAAGKFVTIDGFEALRQGCLSLRRIREILADVVARRRDAGDENISYVDGLELFGAADADDLPDDLHPNPAGYIRMGHRFAEALANSGLA